jgi:DNA-binding NarL/FixJ family response regulator
VKGLRVLVAADHEDLRALLVTLLCSDFQVVAAVDEGEQFVEAAIFLKPDIIISDVGTPWIDSFSAKNELRSRGVRAAFVFVVTIDFDGLFSTSMAEEPVGWVHRYDLFNELKAAVHTVASGNGYISESFG